MPLANNPTQTGHLYIEFLVEFPQTLLPEHRKLLKNSLPETNFMDDDYDSEKVEEVLFK